MAGIATTDGIGRTAGTGGIMVGIAVTGSILHTVTAAHGAIGTTVGTVGEVMRWAPM